MLILILLGKQFRDMQELLNHTQANIMLWNGLLKTSGGALNSPKCVWVNFQWQPSKHGNLTLQNDEQLQVVMM